MATQSQSSGGHSIEQALAHAFAAFGPAYKRWAKTRLSQPHPTDRRATLIELTDAGRQMCNKIGDGHVEAAAELLRALSPRQQDVLLEAMQTLLGELQRRGFCPDPELLMDGSAPQ